MNNTFPMTLQWISLHFNNIILFYILHNSFLLESCLYLQYNNIIQPSINYRVIASLKYFCFSEDYLMYTMKEACEQVGISYETLRFYCNEGLVPNVKRDKNNYRNFDEKNILWLKSLQCLRKCDMSIKDMKKYMSLCLAGEVTISERKHMLAVQKDILLNKINEMNESIDFIDNKQKYFDGVLAGEITYTSNLIDVEK